VTVNLTSSDPSVPVPATAVIGAGHIGVAIPVVVRGVTVPTTVKLTASAPGQPTPATTTVTVNPAALSGLTLTASQATTGQTVSGTVTLDSAPPAAIAVTLAATGAGVSVPATVTIPAGQTSGTCTINTSAVTSPNASTISATFAGVTKTASLFVVPAGSFYDKTITAAPSPIKGGQTVTITLGLNQIVPTGGSVMVSLTSSDPSVAVPASAVIGAGHIGVAIQVVTGTVAKSTAVTITASAFGQSVPASTTVTVTP
jgi:hypothetical protein